MRYKAFTLAEVLIILGIIGVVAALTLPSLIQSIQGKIRAEQIRTVKYKFTKATDKMNSLGLIGPYDSTAAFVAELQKHLRIAKVCTSENLRSCWPYDKVLLQDGKEYDISKVKTGSQFHMSNDGYNDYTSPNVGIITADGTPMILSYNKKCEALDPVVEYSWSTEDNKPVSNATAGCVAAVFEINGNKKPNKLSNDVVLFNANGLGSSCAIELESGKCFGAPFAAGRISKSACEIIKDEMGIKKCGVDADYWAYVVKRCGGVSKVPSMNDLAAIVSAIYDGNPKIPPKQKEVSGLTYKEGTASSLGLPEPYFWFWSSEEISGNVALDRTYQSSKTVMGYGSRENSYGGMGICLTD